MRVARLSFSRSVLFHTGGIDALLFIAMLRDLPSDAKIVGMGEDGVDATCHLLVTSEVFKEVPTGGRLENIIAYFKRLDNGSPAFVELDMSLVLDKERT